MRFKIFNAFLLLSIASVDAFDLSCTVYSGGMQYATTSSYCYVTSLSIVMPGQKISSVNGSPYSTGMQGLWFASRAKLNFLPEGIGNYFPDLRELYLTTNGLLRIQAADLVKLTNLESLYVASNLITELPSDLFKFTPNVKYVDFYYNKIEHIGQNLLTNLLQLKTVQLSYNKCINIYTTSDFWKLRGTFLEKCPHPVDLKEKYCTEDSNKHKQEISNLKAEIEKLKMNRKSVMENAKLKEKEISDLKAEIKELKKNCYNGLLDSSTKLLHEKSRKLNECKVETKEPLAEIIVNVLNTTATKVSLGMTVASSQTKIIKIQDASGNDVKPNQTELVINLQNTLFLPTNLGKFFPSTQRLSITFSGLYRLDAKSFLDMKHLTAVNFTTNKLVEITAAAFSKLSTIKDLDLSNNNIESISEDAFKTNVNLEIVRINNNNLEIIDGQLFNNHKKLQKIFLHQNRLKYINANLLTSLDALKVVNFSGNSCIDLSLPNSTLTEITTAILDNCIAPVEVTCKAEIVDYQLNEVDCEVEELILVQPGAKLLLDELDSEKRIEKFFVIGQKMLFIPIKLSEAFPSLVQLHIEQSQLTTLQKTDFEGFSLLRELTVERNNISRIDEGVFDAIPQITHLNLAHNQIKVLPPKAFAKLIKLKILILKGNQLKRFPENLLPLNRNVIKDLQLQENKLEFIDSKILRLLRNTDVIDLTDNECIDVKYHKADPKGKTLMDLTGIIEFECANDSGKD